MTVTGPQIRAARALLGWTSDRLASECGISYATISKVEQHEGVPPVKATTLHKITTALEAGGIKFLANGKKSGIGVRFNRSMAND